MPIPGMHHPSPCGFTSRMMLALLLAFGALPVARSAQAQETIRGAGIGALLGQAIGGDTESTVIGGVIGAGVGRIKGKQKEKAATNAVPADATPVAEPAPSKDAVSSKPPAASEAPETADPAEALPGTTWKLEKLQPADRVPPFFSKVISFLPEGNLRTLTTDPEGNTTLSEESYNAMGDTLVVNKPEYSVHARYKVDGDQLIISAEDFSAILSRLNAE